jgi:hypothetical protein
MLCLLLLRTLSRMCGVAPRSNTPTPAPCHAPCMQLPCCCHAACKETSAVSAAAADVVQDVCSSLGQHPHHGMRMHACMQLPRTSVADHQG